jgi:hypothetical protein
MIANIDRRCMLGASKITYDLEKRKGPACERSVFGSRDAEPVEYGSRVVASSDANIGAGWLPSRPSAITASTCKQAAIPALSCVSGIGFLEPSILWPSIGPWIAHSCSSIVL